MQWLCCVFGVDTGLKFREVASKGPLDVLIRELCKITESYARAHAHAYPHTPTRIRMRMDTGSSPGCTKHSRGGAPLRPASMTVCETSGDAPPFLKALP